MQPISRVQLNKNLQGKDLGSKAFQKIGGRQGAIGLAGKSMTQIQAHLHKSGLSQEERKKVMATIGVIGGGKDAQYKDIGQHKLKEMIRESAFHEDVLKKTIKSLEAAGDKYGARRFLEKTRDFQEEARERNRSGSTMARLEEEKKAAEASKIKNNTKKDASSGNVESSKKTSSGGSVHLSGVNLPKKPESVSSFEGALGDYKPSENYTGKNISSLVKPNYEKPPEAVDDIGID